SARGRAASRAPSRCPRGGAAPTRCRTATRPARPGRSRRAPTPPPRRSASRATPAAAPSAGSRAPPRSSSRARARSRPAAARGRVPALDPLGQVDLLVRGQQRDFPDLAQVEPQRVERGLDGEIELRPLLLLGQGRLFVRWMLVLLAFDQLDRVVDEVRVEVFDLFFGEVDVLEPGEDLVVVEKALFRSVLYELVQFFDVREGNDDC